MTIEFRSENLGDDPSGHYVYLYRSSSGKPRYVGYGETPSRAMGHQDGSHNRRLEEFIALGAYTLEIAGPYGGAQEGRHVETALISALQPDLNQLAADATRFRPVGVPGDLAYRVPLDPLSESALGRLAGGALIVYLAPGGYMADGRKMADPAHPDVEIIAQDCEKWWQIQRHVNDWRERAELKPQTLIAVFGPKPGARFVMGAFAIDVGSLGHDRGGDRDGAYWTVPLGAWVRSFRLTRRGESGGQGGALGESVHDGGCWPGGSVRG